MLRQSDLTRNQKWPAFLHRCESHDLFPSFFGRWIKGEGAHPRLTRKKSHKKSPRVSEFAPPLSLGRSMATRTNSVVPGSSANAHERLTTRAAQAAKIPFRERKGGQVSRREPGCSKPGGCPSAGAAG